MKGFNVKRIKGWTLLLVWLFYLVVGGPALMSAPDTSLVLLGFAIPLILLIITYNHLLAVL